ncbi:2-keto-3-deoxy-phosphogluconate aldolase [Pelagirhabdus alkalitolerans]|uniref:2-keto-3-deoxy-phosphogluconate aldolase n=1 Tax=Pelagirhabdus alkalitolerans TaxID=1612202 RepID=A0A1G6JSK2_9BACI|nr:bifunctional 4-hydroxy-2-oxoglutarate aldolase/2-dehydro-3-deoxy-phosphogluconate aldolase [Pelagirhabdus alkalitolerans]SDC21667.1 2-keto-3-deoxy-phosphogluconate aldolase [Pelagirhabdus alkalitolerans]
MDMITALKQHKLVAICRQVPSEHIIKTVKAIVDGGIKFIEVTMDKEGAAEDIKQLTTHFNQDDVYIGAGTVLNEKDAKAAIDAGAEFIVSPHLSKDVINYANDHHVPVFPGTLTPTEVQTAYEWGCQFVKIFPAGAMGASYIKNIKGPLGHVDVMATGGVDLDNLAMFIKNGASAIGLGSQLVNLKAVKQGDYQSVEEVAKQYIDVLKEC